MALANEHVSTEAPRGKALGTFLTFKLLYFIIESASKSREDNLGDNFFVQSIL